MAERVVVIMRHLPGCDKTVSKVCAVRNDVGSLDFFAEALLKEHREEFCRQFAEFRRAEFTYSVHTVEKG